MAEPGVSDLEKERLLAEIGVEPSSVMIRRVASAPPPSVPVPVAVPVLPPAAAPPLPPPPSVWLERRHTAAGGVLAMAGSAWTSVALAFGHPGAALLAVLALGAGTAALFRPPPRKTRLKKA